MSGFIRSAITRRPPRSFLHCECRFATRSQRQPHPRASAVHQDWGRCRRRVARGSLGRRAHLPRAAAGDAGEGHAQRRSHARGGGVQQGCCGPFATIRNVVEGGARARLVSCPAVLCSSTEDESSCSPWSFERPFSASSSIRNASPSTCPPSCLTESTVCSGGAAGREQVTDDHHAWPRLDCVVVHLEAVAAVLEIVE